MLEAAAVADRAKLRKRQTIGNLVQRRSRFMVSPGELKGSIRREGFVPSILRGEILGSCHPGSRRKRPIRRPRSCPIFTDREKGIRLYNVPTRGALFVRYSISIPHGNGIKPMPQSSGVSTI